MLKRIASNVRRYDWFAVGIEIFVVIIGLMLAFQLDRWRESIDEPVKSVMFNYYGFDESQHQFRPIQIDTEFRHFELATGVLSHEQEVLIQDNWRIFHPDNFESAKALQLDDADVLAAAKRLRERPKLVDWLPYVRDMQLEQIEVHSMLLDRARMALATLKDYAQEIRAAN